MERLAGPLRKITHAWHEHSRKVTEAKAVKAAELAAQEQARLERVAAMQAEDEAAIAKLFSPAGLRWSELPRDSGSIYIYEAEYMDDRWGAGKRCLTLHHYESTRVKLAEHGGLGDSSLEVSWQDNPNQVVAVYTSDHMGAVTAHILNPATRAFEKRKSDYTNPVIRLTPDQLGRYRYHNRPNDISGKPGINLDLIISNEGIRVARDQHGYSFNKVVNQSHELCGVRTVRANVNFD